MTETDVPSPASLAAFAAQRTTMVDSQVRPSDISDRRIIRAMGSVPREAFVPAHLRAIAYMDNPVALLRGPRPRFLMEPRLLAKLVQLAGIPDGGRVLEIGSGSGYGVAVLASMGCKAVGVEESTELVAMAAGAMAVAEITTAVVKAAPLNAGLVSDGPYDAIILAGSVPEVPPALFDQLKAGGRLVAVVGKGAGAKATVWVRSAKTFAAREAFDASAAPLPGFDQAAQFVL